MKIAYVIMDGLEQFVLTPETDTEKKLVAVLADGRDRDVSVHRGGFYQNRQGYFSHHYPFSGQGPEESAIICLRPAKPVVSAVNDDVPQAAE